MVSELEGLVVRMSAPKGTILMKMRKKDALWRVV